MRKNKKYPANCWKRMNLFHNLLYDNVRFMRRKKTTKINIKIAICSIYKDKSWVDLDILM